MIFFQFGQTEKTEAIAILVCEVENTGFPIDIFVVFSRGNALNHKGSLYSKGDNS